MSQTLPALVVSVGRNAVWVALDDENTARLAAMKRSPGKREMLVPGDRVAVRVLEDGSTLIESVDARAFTLTRRTVEGREKTMAANIDALVTVTSLANPPPRLRTLDQLLAFAELESVDALVVFTKPDLAQESARRDLSSLYTLLGYTTLVVSPKFSQGMQELRTELERRHSLLCGVSGVGKSSIFRAFGGEASVGETSVAGLGRQTTSAARLRRFSSGFLIDSPGIAEFGLGEISPQELAHAFREMREPAQHCRFSDCTHLREPGCAIQAGVGSGSIAQSRYESFRSILNP